MIQFKHFSQLWYSELQAALLTLWTVFQNNRTFFFVPQTLSFPSDKKALKGYVFHSSNNYHDLKLRISSSSLSNNPDGPTSLYYWGFQNTLTHNTRGRTPLGELRLIHTCHAAPMPCRVNSHTCHTAPLPFSDSAVSFVKVRVVAGNIRTANPIV
jgi:hypothetical protein